MPLSKIDMLRLPKKCTNCIIWQNIYQIFEFLVNGRLLVNEADYHDRLGHGVLFTHAHSLIEPIVINLNDAAIINTSNKYDYLYRLLTKMKYIKNPVDPSDTLAWSWDFKSAQHYTLLKLKHKLLYQITQLSRVFEVNSYSGNSMPHAELINLSVCGTTHSISQCTHCLSALKDKRIVELENLLIARLNDYVDRHYVELERAYERFMRVRLKNAFDINTMSDLNAFVRSAPTRYTHRDL